MATARQRRAHQRLTAAAGPRLDAAAAPSAAGTAAGTVSTRGTTSAGRATAFCGNKARQPLVVVNLASANGAECIPATIPHPMSSPVVPVVAFVTQDVAGVVAPGTTAETLPNPIVASQVVEKPAVKPGHYSAHIG